MDDPKHLGMAYAYAVTVRSSDKMQWVARNGEYSLFESLQRALPQVRAPHSEYTPRYALPSDWMDGGADTPADRWAAPHQRQDIVRGIQQVHAGPWRILEPENAVSMLITVSWLRFSIERFDSI